MAKKIKPWQLMLKSGHKKLITEEEKQMLFPFSFEKGVYTRCPVQKKRVEITKLSRASEQETPLGGEDPSRTQYTAGPAHGPLAQSEPAIEILEPAE